MSGCSSTLGAPQTNKFLFGSPEIRIGPISMANKLTQAHSVGVLEDAAFSSTREFVEKRGGPGNAVLARGLSGTDAKITGNWSEITQRNLILLSGQGTAAVDRNLITKLTADAAAGDTSIALASVGVGTDAIVAGDILMVYPDGKPEQIQSVVVEAVAGQNVTLTADTALQYDLLINDIVALSNLTGIGAVCEEQYVTVDLIAMTTDGKPFLIHGWYGSVTSGLELSTNNTAFSSSTFELSLYPTPPNLHAAGGEMEHASDLIVEGQTALILA